MAQSLDVLSQPSSYLPASLRQVSAYGRYADAFLEGENFWKKKTKTKERKQRHEI